MAPPLGISRRFSPLLSASEHMDAWGPDALSLLSEWKSDLDGLTTVPNESPTGDGDT